MYYVQGAGNLLFKLNDLLTEYFGEKADVVWRDGKLYVKVKENSGFKDEEKRLTSEELAAGVCGGGIKLGLDGKTFCIEVKEIDK